MNRISVWLFTIFLVTGIARTDPSYSQQQRTTLQPQPQFWYYCYDPPGYYPYVQNCKSSWREVPAATASQPLTTDQTTDGKNQQPAEQTQKGGAEEINPSAPLIAQPANQPSTESSTEATTENGPQAPPNKLPSTLLLIVVVLLAILAAVNCWLAIRNFPVRAADEAVIVSLKRRAQRWYYARAIMIASLAFALALPGGGYIFGAGFFCAFLFGIFSGRIHIGEENFEANPDFFSAVRRIADLRNVSHFNHSEDFKLRLVKHFEGVRASKPFLIIRSPSRMLILTPARYWTRIGKVFSGAPTSTVTARPFSYKERTWAPRSDDKIVGETWEHATKHGDRDYRYKDNRQLYEVSRYGVELRTQDTLEWNLGGLSESERDITLAAFSIAIGRESGASHSSKGSDERSTRRDRDDRSGNSRSDKSSTEPPWHEVLGVDRNASRAEIIAARNKLVREYHPDRLKSVEGLSSDFERFANGKLAEINAAYQQALEVLSRGA